MLREFTYANYCALLDRIRDDRENLCFGDCREGISAERFFLLRHDIDFGPARALEMARVEAEMGVRATYFLLLTTSHYNLLEKRFIAAPRQIVQLGHEVGLHYDVAVLEAAGCDSRELLGRQAEMLGQLAGQPVRSIAMHNPSTSGADPFRGDSEFVNAYDDAFTKDACYLSDSCGAWRDNAHDIFTSGDIPGKLQLLIHPIHWGETHRHRREILQQWYRRRDEILRQDVRAVEEIWENHTGVAEHDRRCDSKG